VKYVVSWKSPVQAWIKPFESSFPLCLVALWKTLACEDGVVIDDAVLMRSVKAE
jgi:hypothetical protein